MLTPLSDLREAALHCPTLQAALTLYEKNELSLEGAMRYAALALAGHNAQLLKEKAEAWARQSVALDLTAFSNIPVAHTSDIVIFDGRRVEISNQDVQETELELLLVLTIPTQRYLLFPGALQKRLKDRTCEIIYLQRCRLHSALFELIDTEQVAQVSWKITFRRVRRLV